MLSLSHLTLDFQQCSSRKTVRKAFSLWSSQVGINTMESLNLIFEEAESEAEADITILWAEGDHGDAHKFDGYVGIRVTRVAKAMDAMGTNTSSHRITILTACNFGA